MANEQDAQAAIKQDFEKTFKMFYPKLFAYAHTLVQDRMYAEEAVQQVFCRLWEKNTQLIVSISLSAYLYRAVHNECINQLKHKKVQRAHQAFIRHTTTEASTHHPLHHKELQQKATEAFNQLPEKTKLIFSLHRQEELSYKQIADALNLSQKAIEHHMSKALKHLRIALRSFITITAGLLLVINHYINKGEGL